MNIDDNDDEAALLFLEELHLPPRRQLQWGFALGSSTFANRPVLLQHKSAAWVETDDEDHLNTAAAMIVEHFEEGSEERRGDFDLYVMRDRTVRLNSAWAVKGVHRLKDEDELSTEGQTVLFRPQFV